MDRTKKHDPCCVDIEKSFAASNASRVKARGVQSEKKRDGLEMRADGNGNIPAAIEISESSSNAKKNFESLLCDVNEYWEEHQKICFPAELELSQDDDYFSVVTACITKVSGAAMTFSVFVFVQNPEAFGVSSDAISLKKVFQGSSSKLAAQITVGIFITASVLCFVCVIIDTVRRHKDRAARDEFLSKLHEGQKIYTMYRPLIDSEAMSVCRQLAHKCTLMDARIHYLETNDLECSPLMDVIKKIQEEYKEGLLQQQHMIFESLERVNHEIKAVSCIAQQQVKHVESSTFDRIKALEEKVRAHEECVVHTIEEINRCIESNTDTMRNILQRGLESTTKKAEEVKHIIAKLNSDISAILRKGIRETEHAFEQVIQVRQECMRVLSCMFVEKNAAAVAACSALLEAHAHLKEVSLLHASRSYDEMRKKLEYRVPGKMAGFFYDTLTVNETIASVHVILTRELLPILEKAEELRSSSAEHGQQYSQTGDVCIQIIKRCDEKLFSDNGVLSSRVFTEFLRKLSALIGEKRISGNGQDALEKIKKCIPFFLVMPHIIRIALGIEGMHLAADDICAVSKNIGGKFADVFPFFPREHVLTSRLSEPEVTSMSPDTAICKPT